MDISKDYYATLGIDTQASPEAIKAAFKKLALLYHPDVYKGDDAQERMRVLLQAYQTLIDPAIRQEYDEARGLHVKKGYTGNNGNGNYARTHTLHTETRGRFIFPDLPIMPARPVTLELESGSYKLTAPQVENLGLEGVVRGSVVSPAKSGTALTCQRCGHRWPASQGSAVPQTCPECYARDWDEFLLLRCVHCRAVFASKELRDPLRNNVLYYPYELFPLCPNCRRSQWCPAENKRVATLRAAAARRSSFLLWGGSISLIVVLLVVALYIMLMH